VLLTSAGVLLRSLWQFESVPLGMSTEHVVVGAVSLSRQHYGTPAQQQQFWEQLESRVARIPDVRSFSIFFFLTPRGRTRSTLLASLSTPGRGPAASEGTGGMVVWRAITPGYFETLGIPIVRGRSFTEDDRNR